MSSLTNLTALFYSDADSAGAVARLALQHLQTAPVPNSIISVRIWQDDNFGEEASSIVDLLTNGQFRSLRVFEVKHARQIKPFRKLRGHGVQVGSFE